MAARAMETVRISACRMCVMENNTIENANNIGAVLKLHNGNTNNSSSTWTGVYTELVEISDNWFGGTSGAQVVENAPQNAGDDERLRNIVFERNLLAGSTGVQGGRQLLVSAVNETVRDNVFYMIGSSSAVSDLRRPSRGARDRAGSHRCRGVQQYLLRTRCDQRPEVCRIRRRGRPERPGDQ